MDTVQLADLNTQTAALGVLVSERSMQGKGNFPKKIAAMRDARMRLIASMRAACGSSARHRGGRLG
jgi:hypothetical protein